MLTKFSFEHIRQYSQQHTLLPRVCDKVVRKRKLRKIYIQ